MTPNDELIARVTELYQWLDDQAAKMPLTPPGCTACGKCCHFDRYGHRLYVTAVEMIYLAHHCGEDGVKAMTEGHCPYLKNHQCTAYGHRFAGCRIYQCRGDESYQSELSEKTLAKLKALGDEFDIPYQYTDLATALNQNQAQPKESP